MSLFVVSISRFWLNLLSFTLCPLISCIYALETEEADTVYLIPSGNDTLFDITDDITDIKHPLYMTLQSRCFHACCKKHLAGWQLCKRCLNSSVLCYIFYLNGSSSSGISISRPSSSKLEKYSSSSFSNILMALFIRFSSFLLPLTLYKSEAAE